MKNVAIIPLLAFVLLLAVIKPSDAQGHDEYETKRKAKLAKSSSRPPTKGTNTKVAKVVIGVVKPSDAKGHDEYETKRKAKHEKSSSRPPTKGTNTKVVIGGAGFSGISAAQEFDDVGVNFWIAEATDRVGGRIYGDFFGNKKAAAGKQYHVEFGANWIHGLTNNPIWEMAQAYNLDGGLTDFFSIQVYDEKGNLDLAETFLAEGTNCGNAAFALGALRQLSAYCLRLEKGEPYLNDTIKEFCLGALGTDFQPGTNFDISCQQGQIITTGFNPPDEPNPAVARLCQWYSLDLSNTVAPDVLSAKDAVGGGGGGSNSTGRGDFFVRDSRGYKWLVERTGATFLSTSANSQSKIVFNDPRLNLNTKVVKVQWNPKGQKNVKVTLCQTRKVVRPNSPVLYPCIANKKYITVTAKYFFSTFSLGVLKASIKAERNVPDLKKTRDVAPVFVPPLSSVPALAKAITTIGFSVFQKIYVQFPFSFWPEGVELLLTAYSKKKWVGTFAPAWFSLDLQIETDTRYFPGSSILVLVVVGQRAIEVSALTDDAILSEILPVLNLMFADQIQAANGGKLLTASDVLDFNLYRWYDDPLFRGTYSAKIVNAPVTALGDRYGNLVFSGELKCPRRIGDVRGAYLAGIRSARLVSQHLGVKGLNLTSICDL